MYILCKSGDCDWYMKFVRSCHTEKLKFRKFVSHDSSTDLPVSKFWAKKMRENTGVPEACIKGRDMKLHPTDIAGCNYLSLPLKPASGTQQLVETNNKRNIKGPYYWPFVRGINRWPVDSPHKGPEMWKSCQNVTIRNAIVVKMS